MTTQRARKPARANITNNLRPSAAVGAQYSTTQIFSDMNCMAVRPCRGARFTHRDIDPVLETGGARICLTPGFAAGGLVSDHRIATRRRVRRRGETRMVVLEHVAAPDGVAAGRGYSQVVTGRGRLVVVSGQVAQDESGELVGPGDPAAQARQVFENLRRCLAQVGAGFGDVVKLTLFVLNVADLPAVRAARDAVIDTARPPASTAVQVGALFAPGYVLEVEAWALVDD